MEKLIQIIYHFGIKCSQYDNFSRKAFYQAIKSLFNTETIVRFAGRVSFVNRVIFFST